MADFLDSLAKSSPSGESKTKAKPTRGHLTYGGNFRTPKLSDTFRHYAMYGTGFGNFLSLYICVCTGK